MRELAQSGLSTRVEFGAATFRVPPPTVRQALTVLTVAHGGEVMREDLRTLRKVTAEWLPLTAQSVVWGDSFFASEGRRVAFFVRLVRQTLPPSAPEGSKEKEGEAEEKVRLKPPRWWWQQIARYRAHFGLTMEEVMTEPWPEFVAQRRELSLLEARETFRGLQAVVAGHPRTETDDLVDSISEASQFAGTGQEEQAADDEWQMSEEDRKEHFERQAAKLHVAQHALRN